ncbi:uncharacterized protein LOC142167423 [Nicotiana tabacum]|uniref:Uncharacterized protein LOC142167423 n=1 Tax=Nicotiana tabacum TaxID=4097 RepID=A0AC58SFD4_TOBAC
MVKIDFHKAYDSVEWPYLKQVISELGFRDRFVSWIMECVQTVNYTVMVERDRIVHKLGIPAGELPIRYLGVPLSTKKISFAQWQPLIENIVARITSWTAKQLSYAGRVQLVQSVLFGVQSYWSKLFQMPVKVLKLIDAYCRIFAWSGIETITKKALVSWEKMHFPKTFGGLNLLNTRIWNRAALAKTHWDLAHKDDKLWIHEFYLKSQPLTIARIPQQACWIMRKILEARQTLLQVQIRKGPGSLTNKFMSNCYLVILKYPGNV